MRLKNGEGSSREVGAYYESIASWYLEKKGYTVLERNFRCRQGEIDLIAKDKEYLCFIEVKYRTSGEFGGALGAITAKKQIRISKTALYYLTQHGYGENQPCRFDVLAVSPEKISLIKDAFEYRG